MEHIRMLGSLLCGLSILLSGTLFADVNASAPAWEVKICWIHHSCGSYWTHSTSSNPNYGGNLGQTLNANNYYITECDYGWTFPGDPYGTIGNQTDTDDWAKWFNNTTMPHVYSNSSHYDWTNTISDPGGENEIVMFKSCYPLSEVGGSIDDEKALYNAFLPYFQAHPDKLFVLVTPPGETVVSSWVLTEELCNWLCDEATGWLSSYPRKNVAVFDFYNVLSETDAHHRVHGGVVQHVNSPSADGTSPYHSVGGDNHPDSAGNQKSTAEYVPLLNFFYNRWFYFTRGDASADGWVEAEDVVGIAGNWGNSGTGDFDEDGTVGSGDLGIQMSHWTG